MWGFVNLIFTFCVLAHLSFYACLNLTFIFLWMLLTVKLLSTASHVLMVLLLLEVFMLITMLILNFNKLNFSSNSETLMVFFTLAVCEASLGLGLLIQLSRKMGSELIFLMYIF